MSNNFDWRSDEDVVWDDGLPQPQTAESRRSRLWLVLLLSVAMVAAAGWLITRQVHQRVAQATSRVEADVQASHDLVLDAAARHDSELLRSVLSGRNDDWVEMQETLVDAGAFLDRSLLGLELQPATSPLPPTMTLNPELNSVEVLFTRDYRVLNEAGTEEVITLRHTAVYRRGSQRWLYAPPAASFWGGRISSRGDSLTLHYYSREDRWARRLANDLESFLHKLCEVMPELDCDEDLHLQLYLEHEAAVLELFLDPAYSWQTDDWTLALPALTLFGQPVDEAGYQALYRAYAAQVAMAVTSTLVEYDCCEKGRFIFEALLDYELFQLDLKPWPVTQWDHWIVFAFQPQMRTFLADQYETDLEALPAEDKSILYSLVDFMLSKELPVPEEAGEIAITPVKMQRSLVAALDSRERAGGDIVNNWVSGVFSEWLTWGSTARIIFNLEPAWWGYAEAEAMVVPTDPPPVPLPDQDLLLTCQFPTDDDLPENIRLLRYNPETEIWTDVWERPGFGFVNVLPDDATRLNNFTERSIETWSLLVNRRGTERAVEPNNSFVLSLGQVDPDGRWLTVFSGDDLGNGLQANLLDLERCPEEKCELIEMLGLPYWAPDSRHLILEQPQDEASSFFRTVQLVNDRYVMLEPPRQNALPAARQLWLATDPARPDNMIDIGEGLIPFWLDAETFGYLQVNGTEQSVVLASIQDLEPETLFTLSDLIDDQVVPYTSMIDMRFGYAFPDPANENRLFFTIFGVFDNLAWILSYELQSGIITSHVQDNYIASHAAGFSPDGRWLALLGINRLDSANRSSSVVSLYDLHQDEAIHYYQGDTIGFLGTGEYDWSAEGQWLVFQVEGEGIGLSVPGTDYQRLIQHDWQNCYSVAWVEREE